jgi:excisionase family DNA binding protein
VTEQEHKSWLSPDEAAAIIGVRVEHIYRWLAEKELVGSNVALDANGERPRWRISRVAVQNFLFAREAAARGYSKP